MFFSSLYPVTGAPDAPDEEPRTSPVDAFLMTSHVYTIDTTSAFFVLAGFFAAYTFANVPSTDPHEICKIVAIYTLIDVWLAGIFDFFDPWGTP